MLSSSTPLQAAMSQFQAIDEVFSTEELQAHNAALSQQNRDFSSSVNNEMKKYAWIPSNLTDRQIRCYFNELPKDKVPVIGSVGEKYRKKQLIHQLPSQDDEASHCKKLNEDEKRELSSFSEMRKIHNKGCGEVQNVPFNERGSHCSTCGNPFKHSDMSIVAKKHCTMMRWHPGCFLCSVCGELLVDLIYFYEDGKIYCGRHHAETLKFRCSACDEIIFADECTEAEGRYWHMNHFCCYECDQMLGGERYVFRDGRVYCVKCFEDLHSDDCETCNQRIGLDEGQINHEGHRWHASGRCFRCDRCKTSLLGKPFSPRHGKVFCTGHCSRNLEPSLTKSDSYNSSAYCEAAPLPVSHNIRHSFNLENLSLHDNQTNMSRQYPSEEHGVCVESKDMCPYNDTTTNQHFTHRIDGHFLTAINKAEETIECDLFKRQNPITKIHSSVPSTPAKRLSPTSTVSSKTTNQINPHGVNTYKSTDSSGYSSSTVDFLEQSQGNKEQTTFGTKLYYQNSSSSVDLPSSKVAEFPTLLGEDCPEVATSEFSFHTGTIARKLLADSNPKEKAVPHHRKLNRVSSNQKVENFSQRLPASTSVPAANSFYPKSAPLQQPKVKPDLPNPWLHKSEVQQSITSPQKIASESISAKPTIQRSNSERIFNHQRTQSSPCFSVLVDHDPSHKLPILPEKIKGSATPSKSNMGRKELKSILKKTKSTKASKSRSKTSLNSDESVFLDDTRSIDFFKKTRVNFQRNQRLYSSSRSPHTSGIHVPSQSPNWRNRKHCHKKLKRTRSSDFVYKKPSLVSNSRRRPQMFDDDDSDEWCSTCTSSSDESDYERWDILGTLSNKQDKPRRGSVPLQKSPISHRRPSQPVFTTNNSFDFTTNHGVTRKSSNRRRSRDKSHDKKQCVIQ